MIYLVWIVFIIGSQVYGEEHNTTELRNVNNKRHAIKRRIDVADNQDFTIPPTKEGEKHQDVIAAATRFTTPSTTTQRFRRTTPRRYSFVEDCDYLAQYCLKAYDTGELCGRTLYYNYRTFKNYCMLDYVNCMERYEVWQVVHMGECFKVTPLTEYIAYPYDDDYFLDQYYILEDN